MLVTFFRKKSNMAVNKIFLKAEEIILKRKVLKVCIEYYNFLFPSNLRLNLYTRYITKTSSYPFIPFIAQIINYCELGLNRQTVSLKYNQSLLSPDWNLWQSRSQDLFKFATVACPRSIYNTIRCSREFPKILHVNKIN